MCLTRLPEVVNATISQECIAKNTSAVEQNASIVHAHPWSFSSAFQMSIACTGRVTAVASMYIALHIVDSQGNSIPGSPIKLHLRKKCVASGESQAFDCFTCS